MPEEKPPKSPEKDGQKKKKTRGTPFFKSLKSSLLGSLEKQGDGDQKSSEEGAGKSNGDVPDSTVKSDKVEKADKTGVDKSGKVEKANKTETDKSDKVEKADKFHKSGKSDNKMDKVYKSDQSNKPDKSDESDNTDKAENIKKTYKTENKAEKTEKTKDTDEAPQTSEEDSSPYFINDFKAHQRFQSLRERKSTIIKAVAITVGIILIVMGIFYVLSPVDQVASNVIFGERAMFGVFLILAAILILAAVFASRLLEARYIKDIYHDLEIVEGKNQKDDHENSQYENSNHDPLVERVNKKDKEEDK